MEETFGFRLRRFALAVDIVDRALWDEIWNLILAYLRRSLNPQYYAVLVAGAVDSDLALQSTACSRDGLPTFRIKRDDGTWSGLAGYAFARWKQLWVIAEDQGPLGPGVARRDLWSHVDDLPEFDREQDEGIRTVIMVPLGTRERKVGLLDLHMTGYFEVTEQVKVELENLAHTLAVLIPLCRETEERRAHTKEAIELHREALQRARWPPLAKPQLFLSSPARADREVMAVIDDVLDQFRDRVSVQDWREAVNGNINVEMLRQIQASQYGLCYFSEPGPNGGPPFQDNPNVLFEAGMMQALSMEEEPRAWIPVRERDAAPPPFNFAQQGMVLIDRKESGQLKKDKLRADLEAQLTAILGQ